MNKQKTIILDLDDCCLDFIGTLCIIAKTAENVNFSKKDLTEWVLPEELQKIFRKYEREIYLLEPLFPEAKDFLFKLKQMNYKVIFITARDEKFKKETELNLAMNEIQYEEIYFNKNKALKINRLSEKYDIVAFADDKIETVNKVKEDTNIPSVYLVEAPSNKIGVLKAGIIKIKALNEIMVTNENEWKVFIKE